MAALTPSQSLPKPNNATTLFYDIGANVGYYSFLFAAHGYTSVAVEPEPGNVALLRASACLNPRLKVDIVPVAVTNHVELEGGSSCRLWARAQTPRTQPYLHAMARLTCTPEQQQQPCYASRSEICVDPVPVTTLAQLLLMRNQTTTTTHINNNNNNTITIVKIDVEGHELQVLQGLLLLLGWNASSSWRPQLIQFENKDPRIVQQVTDLLESAGYTLGTARGHDQNTMAELLSP